MFGLALGGFFVAGPVAGLVFSILGLGLVYLIAEKLAGDERPDLIALEEDPQKRGHTRRVLVVGNHGLERSDLHQRLRRIGGRHPAEIRIVAPGASPSFLHELADDTDDERAETVKRVAALVERLRYDGIQTSGRVDDQADPRTALLDGLREFEPDEVILVRGTERHWDEAGEVAEELRERWRLPVTNLGINGTHHSLGT